MASVSDIRIFISVIDGDTLPPIEAKATDTIQSVKQRVFELRGLPVENQILKDLGTILDNYRTLQSYNIQGTKTLHLIPSGATISTQTGPANEPKILKTLFFKDLAGKSLTLSDVPLSMTVQELRERIFREEKFTLGKGELRFIYAGKEWVDGKTLEDYNVWEDATIHLVARLRGGRRME